MHGSDRPRLPPDGKSRVRSLFFRDSRRTTSPSLSARTRWPSNLISSDESGPRGTTCVGAFGSATTRPAVGIMLHGVNTSGSRGEEALGEAKKAGRKAG